MGIYRLTDILKNKSIGEEWYCYEAPEETHFWSSSSHWKEGLFKKCGLSLASVSVQAITKIDTNINRFKKSAPMRLPCGVEIESGYFKTELKKEARCRFRVDCIPDLNMIMTDLSKETGLSFWEIKTLSVYNSLKGAEILFAKHNPDSVGVSLYLRRVDTASGSRLYPEISLHEQMELLGKFQNKLAHCTAIEFKSKGHGCSLEKRTKKALLKKEPKIKIALGARA